MDSIRINKFLNDLKQNNHKDWFQENRDEYLACKQDFENNVDQAIRRIATFDDSIAHLTAKDCIYRFNRDTRFSPDKSPYKTHLGAYIAAHGKKALHGGYYIHVEPGCSMLACGTYWLPTNILTACRNELIANSGEWSKYVDNPDFVRLFGRVRNSSYGNRNGFGMSFLKTCPKGFSKDEKQLDYLRMKDYCCWHGVDDDFFCSPSWMDEMEHIFRTGKPMMDFINAVVDDYE